MVSGSRVVRGARAPLFDRLVDDDPAVPHEPRPKRMLDPAGLRLSVIRELDRLLNTRTPLAADELERRPRSTLDYGIPDLSLFWPFDADSEAKLVGLIERSIQAYEPRLRNPRIRIERLAHERRSLLAHVTGEIAVGTLVEPVAFPVMMRDGLGLSDEQ
jgi:type VI secretion system lysozyme-like protein